MRPISAPYLLCSALRRGVRRSDTNGLDVAAAPAAAATSTIEQPQLSEAEIVNECVTDPVSTDLEALPLLDTVLSSTFFAHVNVFDCADIELPDPATAITTFPDATPLSDADADEPVPAPPEL